jgi:hypothetical protein
MERKDGNGRKFREMCLWLWKLVLCLARGSERGEDEEDGKARLFST